MAEEDELEECFLLALCCCFGTTSDMARSGKEAEEGKKGDETEGEEWAVSGVEEDSVLRLKRKGRPLPALLLLLSVYSEEGADEEEVLRSSGDSC